jgi:hypothetical protein
MTGTATLAAALDAREAEIEQARERLSRIQTVEGEIADIRVEITRFEQRRDKAAAYGTKQLPIPQRPVQVPGISQVEIAPLLSLETGEQIGQRFQDRIDELQRELDKREVEAAAPFAAS